MIEIIKKITSPDKEERFNKILSLIERDYIVEDGFDGKNIIIPAASYKKLTLMAHYDVFPGSLGYNDNSSSIAVLLSLQNKVNGNIEIVFTDREELDRAGACDYINKNNPEAVINLDVAGVGDSVFYYDTLGNFPLDFQKAYSEIYQLPSHPTCDSSATSYAGIPSLLVSASYADSPDPIGEILKTMHNEQLDNRIEIISEDVLGKVKTFVLNLTELFYNKNERVLSFKSVNGVETPNLGVSTERRLK